MSSSAAQRPDEESALLRERHVSSKSRVRQSINIEHWYSHPFRSQSRAVQSTRQQTKRFLSSKTGHYSVLGLVTLDVLGIITDFILNLFKCEQGKEGPNWDKALEALGIISLAFSSLFVLELIASVWAFGWGYFKSWFHCFDAIVIVGGFIVDVLLRGIIEEAASLIVILRLWRVFKIIEELSVGAQEQSGDLEQTIKELKAEIERLKKTNDRH